MKTIAALGLLALTPVAVAQSLADETFEDQVIGTFPDCPWLDTLAVDTPPDVTLPSCAVIETTDADGLPTLALQTTQAAGSDGVYAPIPISDRYVVRADVRIDAFDPAADPKFPGSNWAMYVSVSQAADFFAGGWAGVGLYASAGTQGWRLYVAGSIDSPVFADIDVELPVVIGVWYHVEVEVLRQTGEIRSRILDAATDEVLLDRVDVIPDWTPESGPFDAVACFDGDNLPTKTANQATIDNITYEVGYPAPTGPTGDLDGDGVVGPADLAILLANWG